MKAELDINGILERAKIVLHARNDTHLSIILGRKSNQVSQWKGQKTADWELIIFKCGDLCNLHWLFTNKGSPDIDSKDILDDIIKKQKEYILKNIESILRGEIDNI